MRFSGVGADTEHDNRFRLKFGIHVPKTASLLCASLGVIARIEIQHDSVPMQFAQGHNHAVTISQAEVGSNITDIQYHFRHCPPLSQSERFY